MAQISAADLAQMRRDEQSIFGDTGYVRTITRVSAAGGHTETPAVAGPYSCSLSVDGKGIAALLAQGIAGVTPYIIAMAHNAPDLDAGDEILIGTRTFTVQAAPVASALAVGRRYSCIEAVR